MNVLAPLIIVVVGFFTYFLNYERPPALFWDENYYLTAATKYEKGIFFEESHPPLAKLIIAAGDLLINANPGMANEFEKTDYTKTVPNGFSFRGMRFFPTVFGWIDALVFYFLIVTIIANPLWALFITGFYLFDNTLIVHFRGTMLDSIQLFGILMTLLGFFRCYKKKEITKKWLLVMGFGIAWATWVKLNGAITFMMPVFLLFLIPGDWIHKLKTMAKHSLWIALSFFVLSYAVWETHFALGKHLEPALQNSGWYFASEELREIKLHPEEHPNFVDNFYVELRDYFVYMKQYAAGVPKLDVCKKGENGSPFYVWPFGAKTINYRWQTDDGGKSYSYLYLVCNPVTWLLSTFAVFLTMAYFIMRGTFEDFKSEFDDEYPLLCLLILYICYIFAMTQISRVMYLYHYFVPFIFSLIMLALWINKFETKWKLPYIHRYILGAVLLSFIFFSPLSYYHALTCDAIKLRSWVPAWKLQGINCQM